MTFECAVNIMDCFFYDGVKLLFQIALQILNENKDALLNAKDDGEALVILNRYLDRIEPEERIFKQRHKRDPSSSAERVDISELINQSYRSFGQSLALNEIENLRIRHRLKVL